MTADYPASIISPWIFIRFIDFLPISIQANTKTRFMIENVGGAYQPCPNWHKVGKLLLKLPLKLSDYSSSKSQMLKNLISDTPFFKNPVSPELEKQYEISRYSLQFIIGQ